MPLTIWGRHHWMLGMWSRPGVPWRLWSMVLPIAWGCFWLGCCCGFTYRCLGFVVFSIWSSRSRFKKWQDITLAMELERSTTRSLYWGRVLCPCVIVFRVSSSRLRFKTIPLRLHNDGGPFAPPQRPSCCESVSWTAIVLGNLPLSVSESFLCRFCGANKPRLKFLRRFSLHHMSGCKNYGLLLGPQSIN